MFHLRAPFPPYTLNRFISELFIILDIRYFFWNRLSPFVWINRRTRECRFYKHPLLFRTGFSCRYLIRCYIFYLFYEWVVGRNFLRTLRAVRRNIRLRFYYASSSGVVCESVRSAVADGSCVSIPSPCSSGSDTSGNVEVPPLI